VAAGWSGGQASMARPSPRHGPSQARAWPISKGPGIAARDDRGLIDPDVTPLVDFIFSLRGLVTSLLAGVLWLGAFPQSTRPRRFLSFIALAYTLSTIYAIDYGVGRLLVIGFRPFAASDVPDGRTAIVVLGSGSFTARDWNDDEYSIVDPTAASRVVEAARVYRLVNPDLVISSGGRVRPRNRNVPTAIAMRDALVQLGIPPSRIVVEPDSRSTHEEASRDAQMLATRNIAHVVVVTSAMHMRRSLGTFRAEGVAAIPAIARDPYRARSWDEWIVPGDLGLQTSSSVAHEILGIVDYAARGWYRF
jgi:uncharacterized SAM-binding protein YcdF (DUF218 family)